MTSSFLLRARAVWLFGTGLVIAGLLLLLYFVALLFWQFATPGSQTLGAVLQFVDRSLLRPGIVDPVLGLLPAPAWLTSLHIAMAAALLGVALGSLGMLIVRWQAARISVERRRVQDRLRRVHQYRDASRLEPFFGPGTAAGTDDAQRRRVA
ncbi:MAG TPA: hypothetical protein VFZ81_00915 [Burkholderiales bacterium]